MEFLKLHLRATEAEVFINPRFILEMGRAHFSDGSSGTYLYIPDRGSKHVVVTEDVDDIRAQMLEI